MNRTSTCLGLAICFVLAGACRKPVAPPPDDHDEMAAPTDRIDVPETVRRNLGIRFVAVERRRIAATLRIPGSFELMADARREYRTPVAGRVEIACRQLQEVRPGDVLCRIESPQWRALQRELGEKITAIAVLEARHDSMEPLLQAHAQHEQALHAAIEVLQARVRSLEETRREVGGQAAELAAARTQLAQARTQDAESEEKHAGLEATRRQIAAELAAARDAIELAMAAAATLAGETKAALLAERDPDRTPRWRQLDRLEHKAVAAGIVDALPISNGGWAHEGDLLATVTDPRLVRFRGRGLQSDLARLRTGLPARLVPPQTDAGAAATLITVLEVGVHADPDQRTLELFAVPPPSSSWARPGIAAFLEIETEASQREELAVPVGAVLRDGLQRILFRRDPANQDRVIRLEADTGLDDGRWIEILSGLADGDQIVLDGAYELMLASSGMAQKGGHFHADGTFHAEEHK
jgi:HlyD family secretion protein